MVQHPLLLPSLPPRHVLTYPLPHPLHQIVAFIVPYLRRSPFYQLQNWTRGSAGKESRRIPEAVLEVLVFVIEVDVEVVVLGVFFLGVKLFVIELLLWNFPQLFWERKGKFMRFGFELLFVLEVDLNFLYNLFLPFFWNLNVHVRRRKLGVIALGGILFLWNFVELFCEQLFLLAFELAVFLFFVILTV